MSWQQLHIIIPSEQASILEEELLALDSLCITLQDAEDEPLFEPAIGETPLWSKTKLTALFTLDDDVRKVAGQLQDLHPGQTLNVKIELLADQDWERVWLEYFKPMQFGDNLWVVPTGYDIPDPSAVNLLLDPGLAFGTGTHPTTAMCLQWLAEHDVVGKTVIDYGCGSGILAIAALKLGAAHVWAIDYDPQAVTATNENGRRNDVDFSKLSCGQNADLPEGYQADIMVANILANPLINLVETLASHVTPNGDIVLSGILAEQAESVSLAYQPYFSMEPAYQEDDWVRLAGCKRKAKLTDL
jgi:ribosomal protein L11 methyltransferase